MQMDFCSCDYEKAPTWSWRELRIGYFSQSLSWESGLLYVFSQIIEVAVALPSSTCLCSASWECPVTWLIWIIKEHKSISWQRKKKPATHLRVLKHLRKKINAQHRANGLYWRWKKDIRILTTVMQR